MSFRMVYDKWERKIKFYSRALMISGAINVFFLAFFVYSFLQDHQMIVSFGMQPFGLFQKDKELTSRQILSDYAGLSFRELVSLLSDKQLVEDGYSKRDLALGCLVFFHQFNLEKALSSPIEQTRSISFVNSNQEPVDLFLFPGMSDFHFQEIIHYAYTEKWPLTTKGLFTFLQKMEKPRDASLEEALMTTQEFYLFRTLFNREGEEILPKDLLDLICEGNFGLFDNFVYEQKQLQDLSLERRRSVLLSFLEERSPKAAELLLKIDYNYVTKKLDDTRVLVILDTVKEKNSVGEQFCKDLLLNQRSNEIWQTSAKKLYEWRGEIFPEAFDRESALVHFGLKEKKPELPIVKAVEKKEQKQSKTVTKIAAKDGKVSEAGKSSEKGQKSHKGKIHHVQDGENLWKIARKYKVPIDDLRKFNHLTSDKLKPGMELKIPN